MSEQEMLQPIFLIGAGRSGTKFVRDLLAVSAEVAVVPYDIGYVWRYGNEQLTHDELTDDMLSNRIKKYIRSQLPKLFKGGIRDTNKFFIEKSVPNALRPSYLHSVYPSAKFIHLVRDGRAVTESSIRMWKNPPKKTYLIDKLKYFPWKNYKYALWYLKNMIAGVFSSRGQKVWGPRYSGIENDLENMTLEEVCAKQWSKCVSISKSQLSLIPSGQIFDLRYEHLMQNKDSLYRLLDYVGLNEESKNLVSSRYEEIVERSNMDKWRERLTEDQLMRIMPMIEEELIMLDYKL